MKFTNLNRVTVHYRVDGPAGGLPVVFANALGMDLRIWEPALSHLPSGLRIIRFDTRGHGLSDAPKGPYFMGDLVADCAALLDNLGVRNCVFVGLSLGGMIAQGLAAERPDLVQALVLANTAAKIGTPDRWAERIAAVRTGGIAAIADGVLDAWFPAAWRTQNPDAFAGWRNMLLRAPVEGYLGCCAAVADTDLYDSTARLRLPTLALAADRDGSTPPDLVRETASLIAASEFALVPGAGHMACITHADVFAGHLRLFLADKATIAPAPPKLR